MKEQLTLALDKMPLTADEEKLLDRMTRWWGGMAFSTIKYQLDWKHDRASKTLQGLLDKGLVWGVGICGEYFVESKYPVKEFGPGEDQEGETK